MIGRLLSPVPDTTDEEATELRGFDDYEIRLGDMLRGERATLGKSLLDVQRELRIKAAYIAAIENSDPTAFDTPGFIAGYVRSYARYLNLDPDETFKRFCAESGFAVAHGMASEASAKRKKRSEERLSRPQGLERDPFTAPNTPFVPAGESFFSQIEPRAIGSTLVLVALIVGIGYGGWSVLKEVQQVQFAPVEQTPVVLAELDPLTSATDPGPQLPEAAATPSAEALDRLYRPQALDVPVMVARDAPIATLDPRELGVYSSPSLPNVQVADNQSRSFDIELPPPPQVVEDVPKQLKIVAVRTSWMRVTAPDGTVILEETMQPGSVYEVPLFEEPPVLRAGASGGVYFEIGDQLYGPVGAPGSVTKNVALTIDAVEERYQVADLAKDDDLRRYAEVSIPGLGPDATAD